MTEKEKINAIDIVKQMVTDGQVSQEVAEKYFPELKESEDERIRKVLVDFFKSYKEQGTCGAETFNGIPTDNILAWLEKQGKQQKLVPKFKIGDTMRTLQEAADGYTDGMPVVISVDKEYYHCTNELIAIKDQDDYEFPPMNRTQTHTDKVEPKFKVGDWITDGNSVLHITNMDYGFYQFEDSYDAISIIDKKYRLWTISDARDGDVLADGNAACIFRKTMDDDDAIWVNTYCGINIDNEFKVNDEYECWCLSEDCSPATKEQRELLFQKMKEAGYEWDEMKMEPKKIEQKFNIGDEIKTANEEPLTITKIDENGYWSEDLFICSFDDAVKWELVEQNSTWSEEDEKIGKELIDFCVKCSQGHTIVNSQDDFRRWTTWLKSLKPQLKNEWSKEDEREVAVLEAYIRSKDWSERHIDRALGIVDELVNKAKSLIPQNTWKPSEHELEVLKLVAEKDGTCLMGLYKQLKKLREE